VPSLLREQRIQLGSFAKPQAPGHIRLLSFNIQVGIGTGAYHHYLTKSWQHLLPTGSRNNNLDRIAGLIRHFDIVALQEVDGGSFRSGFVNQVEYLANKSLMPFWYQQLNRDLGPFAQHSNGVLSRYRPCLVEDHKLPGFVPGRGAILLRFGEGADALLVIVMHLALSRGAQARQLAYIRELIGEHKHVVLMGDMNTHAEHLLVNSPLHDLGLQCVTNGLPTFPSWQPQKSLDHILVSDSVHITKAATLNLPVSDHLPVALEIRLPQTVTLL
jgi:endonuclease/exonuclease/phosphatase family metal-dependent hydrolase